MESYFQCMKDMWVHYFTVLPLNEYEYGMYGKLIDKIKKINWNLQKRKRNWLI